MRNAIQLTHKIFPNGRDPGCNWQNRECNAKTQSEWKMFVLSVAFFVGIKSSCQMQNDIKQTQIIIIIMTIHFQTDTTQRQNKSVLDFNEFSEILISLSVSFQ